MTHNNFRTHFSALIGRLIIAVTYLFGSALKIVFFVTMLATVAGEGVSLIQIALGVGIALEALAGILLLIGWQTRVAASLLFVFAVLLGVVEVCSSHLLPSQLLPDLLPYLTVLGGTLYAMAFGAGAYSIDGLRSRLKHSSGAGRRMD